MNYSRKKVFDYLIYSIILMNILMGVWNWYTDGFHEAMFNLSCAIWLFMIQHLLNHVNRLMQVVTEQREEIERLNGEIVKRDIDVQDFKRAMRI